MHTLEEGGQGAVDAGSPNIYQLMYGVLPLHRHWTEMRAVGIFLTCWAEHRGHADAWVGRGQGRCEVDSAGGPPMVQPPHDMLADA